MTRAEAVAMALALLSDNDIVVAATERSPVRRTGPAIAPAPSICSLDGSGGLDRARTRDDPDGEGRRPRRDGNLLMGFGGLALVGGLKPPNLYHLVLDNGCYATTGGQPALSQQVDLAAARLAPGTLGRGAVLRAITSARPWMPGSRRRALRSSISPWRPQTRTCAAHPMTPVQMADRVRVALARS